MVLPLPDLLMANKSLQPSWHLSRTDGCNEIILGGDWFEDLGFIPEFAQSLVDGMPPGQSLRFDVAGIGRWDTGLIAFLWDVKRAAADARIGIDVSALPKAARKLLALLPASSVEPGPAVKVHVQPLTWLGDNTVGLLAELGTISTLLATTLRGGALAVLGRAHMRKVDLFANIRDAGPSALTIVGVVNFLVGAILAFVGAVQLRKFAADMYVANLVALALVREMAAVMTAIVMAGRTGGAYAARIATMQGNEEIDALTVIGIPVSDYILLPAILALVVTMPFLYLYGCMIGMLGGFAVAVAMMNVTGAGYLHQTLAAVPFSQFAFGFIKSIAFALLIGVTSCHIGLKSGRSAADVGVAATRAVVIGIVGVIAMDATFAVIANVVGI